jgi:hypothetical protein
LGTRGFIHPFPGKGFLQLMVPVSWILFANMFYLKGKEPARQVAKESGRTNAALIPFMV